MFQPLASSRQVHHIISRLCFKIFDLIASWDSIDSAMSRLSIQVNLSQSDYFQLT